LERCCAPTHWAFRAHLTFGYSETSESRKSQFSIQFTRLFVLEQDDESSLLPRFLSHACRGANCCLRFVELQRNVDDTDNGCFIMLAIYATRDIEASASPAPELSFRASRWFWGFPLTLPAEGLLTLDYEWTDVHPEQFVLCYCEECNGRSIIGKPAPNADAVTFIKSKGTVRTVLNAAGVPQADEAAGGVPQADEAAGSDAVLDSRSVDTAQANRPKGALWPPRPDDPETDDEIADETVPPFDSMAHPHARFFCAHCRLQRTVSA